MSYLIADHVVDRGELSKAKADVIRRTYRRRMSRLAKAFWKLVVLTLVVLVSVWWLRP